MKGLIQDEKSKEYYGVACSAAPKGYLKEASEPYNPDGNDFPFKMHQSEKSFGFSFFITNTPTGFDRQEGFDYTFNPDYKELTLSYLADLN